jgi:hypothetical protein
MKLYYTIDHEDDGSTKDIFVYKIQDNDIVNVCELNEIDIELSSENEINVWLENSDEIDSNIDIELVLL